MTKFRAQLLLLGFLHYHQDNSVDATDVGLLCDTLPSFTEQEYVIDEAMKISIEGFEASISYKSVPNGESEYSIAGC
jgi:hypothetical protein